ncbi:preprotein translocase subunit SecA [Lactobacillus sp. ESL0230]|uniref:preprotein translocase subunit SecA n=1 Tax=Lactobacillus sp. ESL0230 TaxID=2069353 RepID=UPI000EFD6107|nr:preprotein translocase subunit SecA [Lactobacillus sp. ESL0230]RMC46711.1 preprotein translocase subunit SecA [Lactobacillus sp. ESL0230]
MSLKTLIENNKYKVKKLQKIVNQINDYSDTFAQMSDNELKAETPKLKQMLVDGYSMNAILPEAFAAIREADKRVLGLYPYDVQLMGGIVLHQANLAEMRTGEGKTLTETMPVYLNALSGKGVHVVTVNDYLSKRDFEEMGPVFEFMGMTIGQNGEDTSLEQKKEAYACDITYSTNDSLAFDYLKDNMALFKQDQVQRGLNYVIVDEVDSILIDEARTPLIISDNANSYKELYRQADQVAKSMTKADYDYDEESKTITLKLSGVEKANEKLGIKNLYGKDTFLLAHYVDEAMKANYTMEKDKDYIVQDDQVLIVDTFTGRIMDGRRFSDGLHQALETKEGVTINDANRTEASITYQNFFRMYKKLSGMSGTASTESKEFYETFGMQVVTIPTNRPSQRKDLPDILYTTERAKFKAVLQKIIKVHNTHQPILVGTASVEHSEMLSDMLDEQGIGHSTLNAKNNAEEAGIIAQAGQAGAITIATNMAGRGTDIKLGPGVKELGGLYVLGTEKHESRRIDNQLRGRSGRQGDPGITVFYMSLEDDLIRRFGGKKIQKIKDKLVANGNEFEPIENSRIFNSSVTSSQKRVEGNNFDQRKDTLAYDDVMNDERTALYTQRQEVIDSFESLTPYLQAMINRTINRIVDNYYITSTNINYSKMITYIRDALDIDLDPEATKKDLETTIRGDGYRRNLTRIIQKNEAYDSIPIDRIKQLKKVELKEYLFNQALKEVNAKAELLEIPADLREFEKIMILKAIDYNWKNNIDRMEQLRQSITLRGYAQYNPLIEYQNSAHVMYNNMIEEIEKDVSKYFLRAEIRDGGDR